MAKKKVAPEKTMPEKALKTVYQIVLDEQQLTYVLAGLQDHYDGTRKNAKNNKRERIRSAKEFVEAQAFSKKWSDPHFQAKMKAKYWSSDAAFDETKA